MTRDELLAILADMRLAHPFSEATAVAIAGELDPLVTERVDAAYAEGVRAGKAKAKPKQNFVSTPGDGV